MSNTIRLIDYVYCGFCSVVVVSLARCLGFPWAPPHPGRSRGEGARVGRGGGCVGCPPAFRGGRGGGGGWWAGSLTSALALPVLWTPPPEPPGRPSTGQSISPWKWMKYKRNTPGDTRYEREVRTTPFNIFPAQLEQAGPQSVNAQTDAGGTVAYVLFCYVMFALLYQVCSGLFFLLCLLFWFLFWDFLPSLLPWGTSMHASSAQEYNMSSI